MSWTPCYIWIPTKPPPLPPAETEVLLQASAKLNQSIFCLLLLLLYFFYYNYQKTPNNKLKQPPLPRLLCVCSPLETNFCMNLSLWLSLLGCWFFFRFLWHYSNGIIFLWFSVKLTIELTSLLTVIARWYLLTLFTLPTWNLQLCQFENVMT